MDAPSSAAAAADRIRRESLVSADSYRAPETPAERRLAPIWAGALNLDRVGIDDDYFVLGGDSMAATVICAEVERLTSRRVGPSLLMDAPTVSTFASAIDSDQLDLVDRILVPSRTTGDRPPLVFLHGMDGNVFFVRRLSWALPPDQPVYAVQARGLDGRHPPHETVEAMIEDYVEAILAEFGEREIVLGGFCMGGVISIDVLRRLYERGGRSRRLILIDPPPNPVQHQWTPNEREKAAIALLRGSKIADRLQQLTVTRPDLAAEYQPDGARVQHALRVADSLARAYARYSPRWTRVPMTILWSVDRAAQVSGGPSKYPLARGPTHAFVLRNRHFEVTHRRLMQEGLEPIARLLRETIDRDIAKSAARGPAARPPATAPAEAASPKAES